VSMMSLMYLVGKIAKDRAYVTAEDLLPQCLSDLGTTSEAVYHCYYEAYIRTHVVAPLGLPDTGFLPDPAKWARCAVAEQDEQYLYRLIQGYVSDGNTFASGGINGHAGLFTTALDISVMLHRFLTATEDDTYLKRSTIDLFSTIGDASFSSRALGWDTNTDRDGYHYCGTLSEATYLHLGYTGTQVCIDPVSGVYTSLLTNRVYPTDHGTSGGVRIAREAFNTMVHDILGL
ncbi:hypothetical protein KIPB_007957, partial [Kipferlia bialata]